MSELIVDIVRSLVIMITLLTGMAYMTWFERRAISRLQIRIGPNRVGPTGLLQPLADALKLPRHVLIGADDVVEDRRDLAGNAFLAPGQAHREIAGANLFQRAQQFI